MRAKPRVTARPEDLSMFLSELELFERVSSCDSYRIEQKTFSKGKACGESLVLTIEIM